MKSPGQIYRVLRDRRARMQGLCPCCGQSTRDQSELEQTVDRVLKQLDYTAQHSQDAMKREVCRVVALSLRGGK